jgi:hypothetical protein
METQYIDDPGHHFFNNKPESEKDQPKKNKNSKFFVFNLFNK